MEARLLLAGIDASGILTVEGTAGGDVISVQAEAGSIRVTANGISEVFAGGQIDGIRINGGEGDDRITVMAGVVGVRADGGGGNDTLTGGDWSDTLVGGPGTDVVQGGDGDDLIDGRDGQADQIDGGTGNDQCISDSWDRVLNVEAVNPYAVAEDNQPIVVRVLVMNFDPTVASRGGKHTWQVFGWTDPRRLAADYEASIERTSGGMVQMDIVQWMDIDSLVPRADGYVYSPDEYTDIWQTTRQFHSPGEADNAKLMIDYGVPEMVSAGLVDEVWVMGPPGAGADWEASMLGPRSFFINGGVYGDVPSTRPFALYGFNYERGVDCMLENTLHRMENHMSRAYDGWNLANPQTNWDFFTANQAQSPATPAVGSCHYAPNSVSDYDWGNATIVQSTADDWLNYPSLTGVTQPMNYNAWTNGGTRDTFTGHHNWWLEHLPRASGINADGRLNNWWKYLYDYDHYEAGTGRAKPVQVWCDAPDLYNLGGSTYRFSVCYESASPVRMSAVGDGDVEVTGPGGYRQPARLVGVNDGRDGNYRVATYEIDAPGGTWDAAERGTYQISLLAGEVVCADGAAFPEGLIGAISVRSASAAPLEADADTALLLRFDNSLTGAAGETATASAGATYAAGISGNGVHLGSAGYVRYPVTGNINPRAGTVQMWIRPDWPGNDPSNHVLFSVGDGGNSMLILTDAWHPGVKVLMFGDNPDTPQVETGWESNRYCAALINHWKAQEWHQISATWDSDQRFIRVYLDGQLIGDWSGCPRISSYSSSHIHVGRSTTDSPPNATLDELRISSRARTSSEILADYNRAIAVTGLSVEPSPALLAVGNTVRLHAQATDAFGGTHDMFRQVVWSSGNPAIAAVDAAGVLRAVSPGTTTVSASLDGLAASFPVTVADEGRPAAALTAADILEAGAITYTFSVVFADNTAVKSSTLDSRDVRIVGPNGFSQFATFVNSSPAGDGTPRTATYRFTPPGGSWDIADAGVYQVELAERQVADTAGHWATGGILGSFTALPFARLASGRLCLAFPAGPAAIEVGRDGDRIAARLGTLTAKWPASHVLSIACMEPEQGQSLHVAANNLPLVSAPCDSAMSLHVANDAELLLTPWRRLLDLTIAANARASMAPGEGPLRVTGQLRIDPGGALDLRGGVLTIDGVITPPDAALVAAPLRRGIESGCTEGLFSSTAVPGQGLAMRVDDLTRQASIRVGWDGDVNFDGQIDGDDYFLMDRGFVLQMPNPCYGDGDLNYDGRVDVADLRRVDAAYLLKGADAAPPLALAASRPVEAADAAPVERSPVFEDDSDILA